MTIDELAAVVAAHGRWLSGEPDGTRANLSGADLSGANLHRANLGGADLHQANLYGANLSWANLYGADLYGANLRGANLYGADLNQANLSRADLSGANLSGANLSRVDLYEANLIVIQAGAYTGYITRETVSIGCCRVAVTDLPADEDANAWRAIHPKAPAWWGQYGAIVRAALAALNPPVGEEL
jgi:uncharacterized protein YjbI with pentapeptide repeats